MIRLRAIWRNFGSLGVVLGLLSLVYLLPPDTALRDIRAQGVLRACAPAAYPPLVTGDPARPGIDVEILRRVAARLGVGLGLNTNTAMGRDFNPRNWRLTRAQCQVIAGGVVDSPLTRSFLETGPAYAVTGWAMIGPDIPTDLSGRRIGVLVNVSGLDRIGLSSFLRARRAELRILPRPDAFAEAIASGAVEAGVTESLLAASIARDRGWRVADMPEELTRYHLVFGLWKGDLTLKRALEAAFRELEAEGEIDAILERYLGPRPG